MKKSYKVFAKAEKAVADDPVLLERVRYEKLCGVLWGDLDQYITKDEVQRYARLREVADICRAAPDKRSIRGLTSGTGISMREWLANRFLITLPNDTEADWYSAPVIEKLLACTNHGQVRQFVAALPKMARTGQQEIGGTTELLLDGFTLYGSDSRPRLSDDGEYGLLLNGGDAAITTFFLDNVGSEDTCLSLSGIDHDKPGRARFTLAVNGQIVFTGENGFSKKGWSEMRIGIPAGCLRRGDNRLEIKNLEERITFANWIFFRKPELSIPSAWQVLKKWDYADAAVASDMSLHNEEGYAAKMRADKTVFAPIGHPLRVEIEKNAARDREGIGNQIQVVFGYTARVLKKGTLLRVSFWVRSAGPKVPVTAVLMQLGPPFASVGGQDAHKALMIDGQWRQVRLEAETGNTYEGMALPRVFLGNVDQGNVLYFSPVIAEYQER